MQICTILKKKYIYTDISHKKMKHIDTFKFYRHLRSLSEKRYFINLLFIAVLIYT